MSGPATHLWRLPVVLLGFAALVYAIAVGTAPGRRLDDAARPYGEGRTLWGEAFEALIHSLGWASMLLASAILLAVAHRRGGRKLALAAGILLVGANASAQLLEWFLGSADPLGGEEQHGLGAGFFPSGHATAALSLALATVLVSHGRAARPLVWAAGTYAAAIGVGLVAVNFHNPGDVVGGYLLAAAWGSAVLGALRTGRSRAFPLRALWLATRAGAGGALIVVAAALAQPPTDRPAPFVAASFAIIALAWLLILLLQPVPARRG